MTDVPAVLMPDFWPHEAALWFPILETQFSYLQITKQSTIFPRVTPYISKHVAVQVSDILIASSAETPYDDLKSTMTTMTTSRSEGKLLPQQPAVAQSSTNIHGQFSLRSAAVQNKNKQVGMKKLTS